MRPLLLPATIFLMSTGIAAANADAVETCVFDDEDWQTVIEACTTALAGSDDPMEQGRFMLHRAIAREQLGDLRGARLDQILAGQYRPDWFLPFANASVLSEMLEDPLGQRHWAEAAVEAEPENPRAYREIIFLTVNSPEPLSCAPYSDAAISRLPHPIDWGHDIGGDNHLLGQIGTCLHWQERHEEALRAYLSAAELGIDVPWLYRNLAELAYFVLERDEIAVEAATRALTYEDPNPDDVFILIAANLYLDDIAAAREAEATYSHLLDATDGSLDARNFLGWRLYLEGEFEAAADIMARWEATLDADDPTQNGDIANAWDTVAHIRAALGNSDGAVAAFETALAREPDDIVAERRETYRTEMETLGISVAAGDAGLMAGLAECARMGAECRLFFEDDQVAQDALAAEAATE